MSQREVVEHFLTELVRALGTAGLRSTLTTDPVRAGEITAALAAVAGASGQSITWTAINGRRVDATVVTSEDEWRVVCSIDGEGVHSASAFQRPKRFGGVPGGRAVIVTGPSSAGKSTVMRAVLDAAETPWVMFDELSFGTVAWPFLIWPDQSPSLRAGFIAGIAALAAAGNQVIMSSGGARVPGEGLDRVRAAVPTLVVGLDCPLKERIARQAQRADRWGGLTEEDEDSHAGWDLDTRFDTSQVTAEEIAQRILELVADR